MATKTAAKQSPKAAGEIPVRQRLIEAAFSAFMERGFAETSTLEIATRARASKRELYAEFGSKQDVLIACIRERAKRFQMPADLPEPRDRETLARVLTGVGAGHLREISDPAVITVFRLAIAEAVRRLLICCSTGLCHHSTESSPCQEPLMRETLARRRI